MFGLNLNCVVALLVFHYPFVDICHNSMHMNATVCFTITFHIIGDGKDYACGFFMTHCVYIVQGDHFPGPLSALRTMTSELSSLSVSEVHFIRTTELVELALVLKLHIHIVHLLCM